MSPPPPPPTRPPGVLDRVPARFILLGGWLVFLACAYPGLMTWDSYEQLAEARAGVYTDAHPPVVAVIWGLLDRITPGPFAMLVLQSWAFLVGAHLILTRVLRPPHAALAAAGFLLFPPVLAPMMVVWKDCMMAGCLLLGIAGLLDERRGVRIAGLVALALATACRHNAPAATLPIALLLLARDVAPGWRPRARQIAIGLAACLAITVAAFGLNDALADRKTHTWHSSLAVMDIVGTLVLLSDDLPDAEWERLLAGTPLVVHDHIHARARVAYKPTDFSPIVAGADRLFALDATVTTTPSERAAIERAWREVVTAHPGHYLRHRLRTFRAVLALGRRAPAMVVLRTKPDPTAVTFTHAPPRWWGYQARLDAALAWLSTRTPLWRPWLYFFLALALLWPARHHRDAFALLVSGLGFELGMIPFAPTPDYRYSHWMVVCTILAAIMLVARRRAARTVSATSSSSHNRASAAAPRT